MCRESVWARAKVRGWWARVMVVPIGAAGGRCNTVRRKEEGEYPKQQNTNKNEKMGDTLGRKCPARSNYRL